MDDEISELIARNAEENRRDYEDLQRERELDIVNGAMRSTDGTFWIRPDRHFRADGRIQLERDDLEVLIARATALLDTIRSGDLMDAVAATRDLKVVVDEVEHEMIAVARGAHWTWRDIGEALDLHPSSVHRRFAREDVQPRERRR